MGDLVSTHDLTDAVKAVQDSLTYKPEIEEEEKEICCHAEIEADEDDSEPFDGLW